MALTLPTFEIVDPVKQQRLLNAFKPTPTSTNAEAADEYRRWLKYALLGEVTRRERLAALQAAEDSVTDPSDLLEAT